MGANLSYSKFSVKIHPDSEMSHQNKQGIVRPSLSKALGGATISRRYAAGRCADAQNAPRKRSDRTASFGEHTFHVGIERDSELIGDDRAD